MLLVINVIISNINSNKNNLKMTKINQIIPIFDSELHERLRSAKNNGNLGYVVSVQLLSKSSKIRK